MLGSRVIGFSCAFGFALAIGSSAWAEEQTAVEEIVAVLKQRGLIDEAGEAEILAKNAREQANAAARTAAVSASPLDGFLFTGDLRIRNEQFWYDQAFGGTNHDNNVFRYRARLGFTKAVNSWATVGVRFASNSGTNIRSTNTSFGQNDDFAPDPILIDRAFVQIAVPDPGLGLKTQLIAGKVINPFLWKSSPDRLVFDEDINPEGIALTSTLLLSESTKLFATAGYFVIDEEAVTADPFVFGSQLGGSFEVAESVELGGRATFYSFRNIDSSLKTRNTGNGNLASAFNHNNAQILESSVYASVGDLPLGPVLVWVSYAQNLSADPSTVDGIRLGDEDQAFGTGFEFGNAKTCVRVGLSYFHIEANSVLAQFAESDLFDGRTNREGFAAYVTRELAPNTELKLALLEGEEIRTAAPFNSALHTLDEGANRKRLQADLNFKF